MRLLGCWRFGVCGGGSSLDCNEALKWFKSGVDLQALQTVPGALGFMFVFRVSQRPCAAVTRQ